MAMRGEGSRTTLRRISANVGDLLTRRLVFREVQEILGRSSRLLTMPGLFNSWMVGNYIAAASLAVRRQIVRDSKSICLDQLLEEFGRQPSLFSREYFIGCYARPDLARLADKMFDKFAGPGGDHLSRAVIKADRATLRKAIANSSFHGFPLPVYQLAQNPHGLLS
jgi:hypothetical protein